MQHKEEKALRAGFPKWGRLEGDNVGKMVKNCMKMTKSVFLGQNSGGAWGRGGQANFSGSGGGVDPPPVPPTRGNPAEKNLGTFFPDSLKTFSFKTFSWYFLSIRVSIRAFFPTVNALLTTINTIKLTLKNNKAEEYTRTNQQVVKGKNRKCY